MDGRNGMPRNRRLMSNRLEQELSGFEERGMRSNRTRIPAKSYLPKVLLSSNPLVERDLQKTLTQIHLGRTRKQKTWEWNQRHFFVSQIFDPEYNLRFTQGLTKYSTDGTHTASGRRSSRRPSHFRKVVKADTEDEVTDENIVGLGVFMPPLHPSQRFIEKQKIPNGTSTGPKPAPKQGLLGAVSSPDLSYNKDQPANGSGTKLYREKHISNTDIITRDDPPSKEDDPVPVRARRVTLASAKCSTSGRRLHKATSLPEIPLYRPATYDASLQKSTMENPEGNLPKEHFSHLNSKPEILCHDQVIVKLTRSLPLSIMIKANQNINKVVQKRKAVMIERCKTARDKNSFEDPRWKELENVLEAPNQT